MDLEKACKKLLVKDPFYGVFLLNLNKYYGNKCDTACVCRNGINTELCVNKEFWDAQTDEMQLGVLKHELLHIIFKHITFFEYYDDPEHLNIATDCEVNSYIPVLQNDPYCYAARWGLENCLGTKEYYKRIPKDPSNKYSKPGSSDNNDDGDSTKNGSGNPKPIDNHNSWKDFKGLSDAEKELINKQIDYQAKNTAEQIMKTAGHIPGELKSYVDALFVQKPAIFNWKAYFRRMLGNVIDISLRKSRKKESLRFPDCSGIKHRKKSNILIAIDTSGSVSDKDLCDFFSEINHVYKAGAYITLIEFDTKIENTYEYKGKWDKKCTGRGGTEFEEPWQYYIDHKKDFNTFILFTDGYADTNNLRPISDVIWVITSNGNNTNTYPGKTIFIPNE